MEKSYTTTYGRRVNQNRQIDSYLGLEYESLEDDLDSLESLESLDLVENLDVDGVDAVDNPKSRIH